MINYKDINLNFLDIETTGSNYHKDMMTEIYISKVKNGDVIDEYHTLINPQVQVDPFVTKLTGIDNEMLKNEPLFEDVAEDIFDFINEEMIVAHNARFDYSFLKHQLDKYGLTINLNYCCTVKLSRILYPKFKHHNLDSIIQRINFTADDERIEGRHRASFDTDVVRVFFYKALMDHGEEKFLNTFNTAVKSSAIPPALLKIKMEDIPENPGVYLFYGDEELPIYVGMSKNLRRRIYEHFYQDLTLIKDFNINQQLKRIEFIETAGILGASIREALLVKKYQPIYNRMLRRNRELIKLEKFEDENGYLNLKIKSDYDFDIDKNFKNLIGIFRSKIDLVHKLNDLVKEKGLCPKLMGLEKGKGACFLYQLGYCKGACIGKITPEEYNRILQESIDKIKIKNWPFQNEKQITEKSESLEETFTFNKWCLINSSTDDELFKENEKFRFDLEIYKILTRYLKNL